MAEDTNSILEDIRDSFQNQFGNLAESLKPSNILGLFGTELSAPIIGVLGDKLGSVEDFVSQTLKNAYQQEAKDDARVKREEHTNDLLTKIADNTSETKKLSEEAFDFSKKAGGMADEVIGTMTGGIFASLATKGSKLIPKLLKGLGRIALPLSLLFGATDFIKGFKDAENADSIKGIVDAVQAGITNVVTSITFGIISPKNIRNVLENAEETIKSLIKAPIQLVRNLINQTEPIDVVIQNYFVDVIEALTFRYFSRDTISKTVDIVQENIVKFFRAPINLIEQILESKESIYEIVKTAVSDMLSGITLGFLSEENIKASIDYLSNKIKYIFTHPIQAVQNALDGLTEYLEIPDFNIAEPIDKLTDKIVGFFDEVFSSLINFKDILIEKFNEKVQIIIDDFKQKFFGKYDVQESKEKGDELFSDTKTPRSTDKLRQPPKKMETKDQEPKQTNVTTITNNNIISNNRDTNTDLMDVNVAILGL